MVVLLLAHNDQRDRVTICHMTITSRCHNSLPRSSSLCGRLPITSRRASAAQFFREVFVCGQQWSQVTAFKARLLGLLAPPTSHATFFFQTLHTPSGMDLFASLDNIFLAQDPDMSFESSLTDTTSTTLSSLPSQLDIPIDEDRSGSGYFTTYCVIS